MPRNELIQGIFIEEIKNRFLCLVSVDGVDTLCYIPSSCRLSNLVDLKGHVVYLLPVKSKTAKTQYSLFALVHNDQVILLNLAYANRIIEGNLSSRRFSFLGKRKSIKTEHMIEGYKSDLYIEDTATVIEIKSLLTFGACVVFPTIYSQRAIDQMRKLLYLLDCGYHVCYIFVSLAPMVKRVKINDEIPEFLELYKACLGKGMDVKGFSMIMKNGEPTLHSNLVIYTG